MKIVLLVTLFPPLCCDGTELATYYLAEQLTKDGNEVFVITSGDNRLPGTSIMKGFHVYRLFNPQIPILGVCYFWANIVRMIQIIHPDIIHAQSLIMGIPGLFAKKMFQRPLLVWGQGSDIYLPSFFIKITRKTIYKNADSLIALTEHMKNEMERKFFREIHIIPNGINPDLFYTTSSHNSQKNKDNSVLFVGRLHPVKGVEYLIRAIKIVKEKIPQVKLYIVGDGENKESLLIMTKDLGITDSVIFIGQIPNKKIVEIMNQSDIFVLPSLSEAFPLVILQDF